MDITIPGDGFCGTHALFLRMLMTLYTRDATLTKLQSSLEALQAIGVNHTDEPYDKPGMIEALQPIVSAFPLQEQIYAASSDNKTGAGDVLARAIDYIQRSISELQDLEQNANFVALRSKLRNALGPNSTQDDFNAAARDIIMAFIQAPSGRAPNTSTLPNYHAMLRAFMETIVESDTFRQRLAECEQERFDMLRPKMVEMMDIFDITLPEDQLDHYCGELAQALIQHQPSPTPIVNALLTANIPQPRVAELYASPNMGNLLTSFRKSDYSRTNCDSSLYTEESDIMVVNDLFPLLTISDNILGVALSHVNGNHFNMIMPDSGFFHSLLLPSPTARAEVRVSKAASPSDLGASAPPSTQQDKGKPATGADQVTNRSSKIVPHGREQAPINRERLINPKSINSREPHGNKMLGVLQSRTQAPQLQSATEDQKQKLLQNFDTVIDKITHTKKKTHASPEAVSALEDLLSQVQSTRAELNHITLAKLSEDDYTRLNGALITVNKQYNLIKNDISGSNATHKSQKT